MHQFWLMKKKKRAFTLIEILVAIGIIGVLAGVTIQAIAPRKSILAATDSKRTQLARQLERAMYQYLVDFGELPNEGQIREGEANAKPVCVRGVSDSTCVNVDPILVPEYIAYLPEDDLETCALYTGYKVYASSGRPQAYSNYLGKLPGEDIPSEACGSPTPEDIIPLDVRDDGDWGFTTQGAWSIGNTPEGYGNDHRIRDWSAQSSDGYAAIVLAGATPGNEYELFVSWPAFASNATNVTYEIYFGSPSALQATVIKDQSAAPNDGQYAGELWESLGTYTVSTFGMAVRALNTSANDGDVIADGFAVVPR